MALTKRFLLDNDGSNLLLYSLPRDMSTRIEEVVRECADNVTTYLVCPNACGYCYYKSKLVPVRPNPGSGYSVEEALQEGLDPLGMFLRALKEAGKEVIITVRMNDVHFVTDPKHAGHTNPFREKHADAIVDPEAIRAGSGSWLNYCFDYSRREITDHMLAVVSELLDLYGDTIDGIQLDWMRFPRHLSGTPEEVWEKRSFITRYVSDVRKEIERKCPGGLLSVRVPSSSAGCRYIGLDVADWARSGLVDFVTVSPFLTTDFSMPIDDFRTSFEGAAVPIYGAFDIAHQPQMHCPESLRAVASGLYGSGADGIYVFNFPCWAERIGVTPYDWLHGLDAPGSAAAKPLLFSVSTNISRIEHVDMPPQLPVDILDVESVNLIVTLPAKALEDTWRAICVIASGGDVSLSVNGISVPERTYRRRAQLFVEYPAHADQSAQLDPEACRMFLIDPKVLKPGDNTFSVTNTSGAKLTIDRLNLGLW